MTYKDFCNNIKEKMINERGYENVRLIDVRKNNDVILQGLCMGAADGEDSDISPTIYLNGMYEKYLEGATTEDILDLLERSYKDGANKLKFNKNDFLDYEIVRKRLAFKLINYEKNKSLLEEIPHTKVLDLAMCFYYLLEDDKSCVASIQVRNEHLEMWGIARDILIRDALKNTPEMLKVKTITMGEFIRHLGFTRDIFGDDDLEDDYSMIILTNEKKINGAGCFLYEEVLPKISEKMDANLYIIPSSVHEVILVPDNGNIDLCYIKELVKEVNNTKVARDEILSYEVYEYLKDEQELRVCQEICAAS